MPEKLVDRSASVFLRRASHHCLIIDRQQTSTLPLFSCNDRFKPIIFSGTCLDRMHKVEYNRPAHHRVNYHLPPSLVQRLERFDNVVAGLVKQVGVIVFCQDALLFDVRLEKVFFAVQTIKSIE